MSPFKAFPHQPVNTPTARAGQPPNRGMDSLPEVLHHCKTTSNRIVQKWPVLLGGEMANLKKNTREGLSHHTHVVSKYLESLSFLFSKNRLGNLPLNTGERLLGWRMRTWEWHDSDTPCHLGASFDEVHRKAFAALQWAKVWSATMGLGAFISSFEGDGLMMFDAKDASFWVMYWWGYWMFPIYIFQWFFNIWNLMLFAVPRWQWRCDHVCFSWFFVGAEKPFSSVENPMLLSPPWRYTCSPPAIWHLAAETPGFCTPRRA